MTEILQVCNGLSWPAAFTIVGCTACVAWWLK